jgi:peptide deformylase
MIDAGVQVSLLPIYTYDQAVLRRKAKIVHPEKVDREELRKFAENMFETMRNANGIGLAANQVGVLQRLIVIDVSDMEETKGRPSIALVNPIVEVEEGSVTMEEGCLSIPDIREDVERPEHIRLRYMDLDLRDCELQTEGILARVLLHEIDHLNGILFIDRVNAEKRKLLRGRLNKIHRGEIEVAYPIVSGTEHADHHKVA